MRGMVKSPKTIFGIFLFLILTIGGVLIYALVPRNETISENDEDEISPADYSWSDVNIQYGSLDQIGDYSLLIPDNESILQFQFSREYNDSLYVSFLIFDPYTLSIGISRPGYCFTMGSIEPAIYTQYSEGWVHYLFFFEYNDGKATPPRMLSRIYIDSSLAWSSYRDLKKIDTLTFAFYHVLTNPEMQLTCFYAGSSLTTANYTLNFIDSGELV